MHDWLRDAKPFCTRKNMYAYMSCAHCINCTLIVTNLEPGVIPNVLKETLARTNKMNKYLGNVHHDEEWVSEKEATKIEKNLTMLPITRIHTSLTKFNIRF